MQILPRICFPRSIAVSRNDAVLPNLAVSSNRNGKPSDYASFRVYKNPDKEHPMKKTLIRLILAATVLLALSATTAMADGGGFPPLCYPGTHCR